MGCCDGVHVMTTSAEEQYRRYYDINMHVLVIAVENKPMLESLTTLALDIKVESHSSPIGGTRKRGWPLVSTGGVFPDALSVDRLKSSHWLKRDPGFAYFRDTRGEKRGDSYAYACFSSHFPTATRSEGGKKLPEHTVLEYD